MATETMSQGIANGLPAENRPTTGSDGIAALISAGNGSCSPNGQHGSASVGSLSEIASQMDGPSRQRLLLRPSAEEKERWPELSKPLCVDLYSGLGGWSEAFLPEGYRCVGFDVERHEYWVPDHDANDGAKNAGGSWFNIGSPGQKVTNQNPVHRLQAKQGSKLLKYPGELILRDVRSIHGSELKDAAVIVGSPPCQEYSYMAMPWKRAKQIEKALTGRADFPEGYMGSRTIEQLNELFNTCFRIQREAIEAAGHHIPLIVENVRGAQKWVGRARWNYGSFYLWGDVPALMPHTFKATKIPNQGLEQRHPKGISPQWRAKKYAPEIDGGYVNTRNLDSNAGIMDDEAGETSPAGLLSGMGRKVSMNFHEHEKTGKPGRSFQSAAVAEMIDANGTKQGGDWFGKNCESSMSRLYGSKSPKRKAASAMIAKIPLPLALHIARVFQTAMLKWQHEIRLL